MFVLSKHSMRAAGVLVVLVAESLTNFDAVADREASSSSIPTATAAPSPGMWALETVCELQARWPPEITVAYNAALVQLVGELSRELSIEPAGEPDGVVVPVEILIRRTATQAHAGLAAAR